MYIHNKFSFSLKFFFSFSSSQYLKKYLFPHFAALTLFADWTKCETEWNWANESRARMMEKKIYIQHEFVVCKEKKNCNWMRRKRGTEPIWKLMTSLIKMSEWFVYENVKNIWFFQWETMSGGESKQVSESVPKNFHIFPLAFVLKYCYIFMKEPNSLTLRKIVFVLNLIFFVVLIKFLLLLPSFFTRCRLTDWWKFPSSLIISSWW